MVRVTSTVNVRLRNKRDDDGRRLLKLRIGG